MSKKRTNYSAEFKAKVISELFRGEKSLNELAGTYQIAAATLSKWHKQFQENLPALFSKTDTSKDERIAELEQELQASQQKIGQLTIERDWLGKKLTKSLDQTARTALVSAENRELTMTRQSELCHVNRSSAYRRKKENPYGENTYNLALMRRIDELHLANPSWGSRRIAAALQREGKEANRKRVQRLMQKMDICALYPGPNLSRRLHAEYRRPYLLRNLRIDHEDQVWGIDISYLPLKTGFMYLFIIIDWYTRQIVDYELSYSLEKTFVFSCLKRALSQRKPEIINSDQGSHFTNPDYLQLLEDHDVKISMDGKGQALDNIVTERFFRSIKYEDLYINEYESPAELIRAVDHYIRFYNSKRPHQSLAYKTPNEVSQQTPSYDLAA